MLEFRTISRVARVLMDMNQRQMGEALGLNLEAVSCWERGATMPSLKHRKAFEVLCEKHGIGFLANGMPVLIESLRMLPTLELQDNGRLEVA